MTEKVLQERAVAEQAIKLRQTVKARKPTFRRQESWRYKRLKKAWRKPRGIDNKMRRKEKGWPKTVNVGYGGPKIAKGLHPSGYGEVLVHTPDEVAKVEPNTQAIRIAHSVGTRKRIQIASLARERGIRVFNPLVRREVEEEKIKEETPEETTLEPEETKAKPEKKRKRSKRQKREEVKTNES